MPATASRPDPERVPVDVLPVDAAAARGVVERALVQGPIPRYEDLVEIEGLLRDHVAALLPHAERDTAGGILVPGVRRHLAEGMGAGLASARIHVMQLAHDVCALLRFAPGGRP